MLVLLSGSALAGVVGSSHDLSSTNDATIGNAADQGQVCVYCHTPHKAIGQTNGPLWNHNEGSTVLSYTMYTSTTFQGQNQTDPGAESLACLSCHDGTVALDSISNVPGLNETWTEGAPNMTGSALVGAISGSDLSLANDHPIAFTYDTALANADGGLVDPTVDGSGIAPLVLFSDKLECATCHDVHDNTFNAFLRVTDDLSTICTTCHSK